MFAANCKLILLVPAVTAAALLASNGSRVSDEKMPAYVGGFCHCEAKQVDCPIIGNGAAGSCGFTRQFFVPWLIIFPNNVRQHLSTGCGFGPTCPTADEANCFGAC